MRNSAEGKIYSLYVRDPNQNLVEIANYLAGRLWKIDEQQTVVYLRIKKANS